MKLNMCHDVRLGERDTLLVRRPASQNLFIGHWTILGDAAFDIWACGEGGGLYYFD